MRGRLHIDMCMQERLIPSDVGIKIRLVRNKDAFCLMAANANYRLHIVECKLLVRKLRLSPSIFISHAKALERGNARYPLKRIVCKSFTVPQGNLNFTQENVFSGQMPCRVVVGMTDNDGFNGVYNKNPYNFKHYNLMQLKLFLDGQQQAIPVIDTDFENANYINAYLSLFEGTNKLFKDEGLDISRTDYPRGYALFVYDLTPDQSENDHLNLMREGTVRLDAKFSAPLAQTINVIVYAEFENVLELDRYRTVICDFTT
jgi:hypothetical protein